MKSHKVITFSVPQVDLEKLNYTSGNAGAAEVKISLSWGSIYFMWKASDIFIHI